MTVTDVVAILGLVSGTAGTLLPAKARCAVVLWLASRLPTAQRPDEGEVSFARNSPRRAR